MSTAMAKARSTKKAVPVDDATTPYMTLVADSDGTFSARQDVTPQRVKQHNAWIPINTTLTTAADGTVRPKATLAGITISGGGTGPLATEDDGAGHKLTFNWPGSLPKPTINGSKATFTDVYPGVDLVIEAQSTGLSDDLIVHDAKAAANPALKTISIGVSGTGLTVSAVPSGGMQAVTATGTTVFVSPISLMWDSAQPGAAKSATAAPATTAAAPSTTTPHQVVISEAVQGNAIILKPDQAMLTNASTVYPVTIDPTWTEIANAQLELWSDKTFGVYNGTPAPWVNYDATAVRVGNNGTATARSLISFDETFANKLQPYYPSTDQINMYVVKADLNLQRQLSTGCVNVDVWRANPFGANSTWGNQDSPELWPASGIDHNGNTWHNPVGHSQSCSLNPSPYLSDIDVTTQVQDVLKTNGVQSGKTFTVGLRASNEALTTANYGSFNVSSTAQSNTYLAMNFVAEPLVGNTTVGNAVVGNHGLQYAPCSTDRNNPSWLPIQAASIPISAPISEVDPGRWLSWGLYITDVTPGASASSQQLGPIWQQGNGTAQATLAPTTSVTGSSVGNGSLAVQDGHSYFAYFEARDDKEDQNWGQGNANPNSQELYNAWESGSGMAPGGSSCYFRAAFTAPTQPTIIKSDFPASGQTLVNGYPTVGTSGKTVTVNALSTTTPIDHFDWALNTSSTNEGIGANGTPNCYVNGAAVQGIGCGTVGGFNDTNVTTTIPIPASGEHAGNNYLYISAVDKAGNVSQYARWDFFLAQVWQPVSFGNVTGDGIPDLMGVDVGGNLVTYQANLDLTPGASSLVAGSITNAMAPNAVQAAAAASAPNGTSWKTALYTHRGSERVQPTDDMFAWDQTKDAGGTVTGHLYYYYNAVHLTVPTPAGQNPNPPANAFTQTQRAVITRPTCTPSTLNDLCAGYDSTWNSVQQVLALGPVSGGCNIAAPTTACKTNLLTVESYPPGSPSRLWMFSPAGIGQLRNPVLLSVSQPGSWDWSTTHLMAPGNATGHPAPAGASSPAGGLPDLWAVDADGTLWQFVNHSDNGVPGAGLGDLTAKMVIGTPRQFAGYQNYLEPGADPSGNPDLWAVTPDRQVIALAGPIGSASASALSQTVTSPTQIGWGSAAGVNSLQGTSINGGLNGQIISDVAGGATGQKCLDDLHGGLNNGNVVDIYDCNSTWPQQWSFQPDGTIRLMGSNLASSPNLCLDSNGNVQGTRVIVQTCDPSTASGHRGNFQVWRAVASPSVTGHYWIYSPGTGFCLDDTNVSTNNGNQFQIAQCWDSASNGNPAQRFALPTGAGQTQRVEAENLNSWASNNGGSMVIQTNCCGATWSNGAQQMLVNSAAGSTMTLNYYVANAGLYQINPVMTKAVDYGQVSMTVDQTNLHVTFDGYQPSGVSTAPINFGTVNLTAGSHAFTFKASGTNPSSTGNRYNMGLDALVLTPTATAGPTPVLAISSSNPATLNAPVTADASASVPGTAAITGYTFDFGDGTVVGPQAGATAQHTYTTAGTYPVKVTVTDNSVNTTTDTRVTILSGPPVANGNFETGSLSGWTASYNSGITTTNPHGGTYAGQINAPTGGNGSIEQVINGLTPNTSYTLTGWIRTDGGVTILGTKQYDAADDDTGATTTATGWTQLSNQFTTGPTNTSVDIYCYRAEAGTSACDDFTLLATPAAGSVGNPDFETGNLAGWNAAYNAGVTTTNPHGGTYAGQINAPAGGDGSIEQVVSNLTPNTSYTLTGWVRTDGGSTVLGTKQYDTTGNNTDAATTNTGWTLLTDQFTTGISNTSVDIYCYRGTAGTSACDDITLARTPATVANPDFESGSLAGWDASYNADITNTNPHHGTYAGEINATPDAGNGSVEQVVTGLTPNTTYTLTGWVRTDGTNTILGVRQYDAAGDNQDATTTATGWTQLTDQFTTDATGTSVDIYCYRETAGVSACDDISLTKN